MLSVQYGAVKCCRENRQKKEKRIVEYLSIMPSDSVFRMESDGILIGTVQNCKNGCNHQ